MVEVEFIYQQSNIIIQANLNDSFDSLINKFISKTHLSIYNIYFLLNGKDIKKEELIKNVINESEKQKKKMIILVNSINNTLNNDNNNIIKSNDIICPTCKEACVYDIYEHRIRLYNCKNKHIMNNIKLKNFNNTQSIDISQIKCDGCKNKNKSNTYKNEFFICNECKMNLCPLCKSVHDKKHLIINYDEKNYVCNEHNETFVKYCNNCKMDLCFSCLIQHKDHKIIPYENLIIDINVLKKNLNHLKNSIDKFKMN